MTFMCLNYHLIIEMVSKGSNRLCTCNDFHPNMVRFDLFQQKIYNN